MQYYMKHLTFTVIPLILLLSACIGTEQDPTKTWSPQRFYIEAKEALDERDYETAIKHYETLEARFPYGRYAQQAQLEVAYAYYKDNEPALAIAAAERFIRLHPTHANVAYAYYLKGLINFHDTVNPIATFLGADADVSDRDPKAARESYNTFKDLVERFPDSRYAKDAWARMGYLFEALARYEIKVAEFYLKRNAFVAALMRSKEVLKKYQQTPSVEDALGIQIIAYRKMGMTQLMNDTIRVLTTNFPQSRYLSQTEQNS